MISIIERNKAIQLKEHKGSSHIRQKNILKTPRSLGMTICVLISQKQ